MKFVQEFMLALKKKSRQGAAGGSNMVCLSLLPKESILELKKSKCKLFVSVWSYLLSVPNSHIAEPLEQLPWVYRTTCKVRQQQQPKVEEFAVGL